MSSLCAAGVADANLELHCTLQRITPLTPDSMLDSWRPRMVIATNQQYKIDATVCRSLEATTAKLERTQGHHDMEHQSALTTEKWC